MTYTKLEGFFVNADDMERVEGKEDVFLVRAPKMLKASIKQEPMPESEYIKSRLVLAWNGLVQFSLEDEDENLLVVQREDVENLYLALKKLIAPFFGTFKLREI